MIFNNPVFKPADYLANYQQPPEYRSAINQKIQQDQQKILDPQYDQIFNSCTDISSRLNESQFQTFQNNQVLFFGHQSTIEAQKQGQNSLLNDSTFLGIFDSARPNENMERITMGMQQMNSIYNKIGDMGYSSILNSQDYSETVPGGFGSNFCSDIKIDVPQEDMKQTIPPFKIIRQQPQSPLLQNDFRNRTSRNDQINNQNQMRLQSQYERNVSSQDFYKPQPTGQKNEQKNGYNWQKLDKSPSQIQKDPLQEPYKQQNRILNPVPQKPQSSLKDKSQTNQLINNDTEFKSRLETTSSPSINQSGTQKQHIISSTDYASMNERFRKPQNARNPQWQSKYDSQSLLKQKQIMNGNEVMLLCIGCDEMINFVEAEKHSQQCIGSIFIKKNQRLQFFSEIITELNSKLQSLKVNIQSSYQKKRFNYYDKIIEIMDYIIINDKDHQILQNQRSKLQEILKEFQLNQVLFSIIMQLERAILLSEEKQQKIMSLYFENSDGLSNLQSEYSDVERLTYQEKENLYQCKKDYDMMLQVQMQDIENFKYLKPIYREMDHVSQLRSPTQVRSPTRVFSAVSEISYQRNLDLVYEAEPDSQNKEESKRNFFNLAVKCKLNLQHQHPGKNILIQDIYEKSQSLNLKYNQWERFINNEMNNYNS